MVLPILACCICGPSMLPYLPVPAVSFHIRCCVCGPHSRCFFSDPFGKGRENGQTFGCTGLSLRFFCYDFLPYISCLLSCSLSKIQALHVSLSNPLQHRHQPYRHTSASTTTSNHTTASTTEPSQVSTENSNTRTFNDHGRARGTGCTTARKTKLRDTPPPSAPPLATTPAVPREPQEAACDDCGKLGGGDWGIYVYAHTGKKRRVCWDCLECGQCGKHGHGSRTRDWATICENNTGDRRKVCWDCIPPVGERC